MPLMPYLRFFIANKRFVAFGFLAAFASSFGQTYFLGAFSGSIESDFSLSHTGWAFVYLVGTLASALALPITGGLIDRVTLPRYTVSASLLLALGATVMATSTGVVTLAIAIFLLRQGGQGLLSHISMTSMARYFEAGRGRAIALATLGYAAGEATLPRLSLEMRGVLGWRLSFIVVAIVLVGLVLPGLLWLLRGHSERHEQYEDVQKANASKGSSHRASWSRREVLRDIRFYLLLPGILAPAMIITALFFTHNSLAEAKGWSESWIMGNYGVYALASTVIGLSCGTLIDKLGGTRLVPLMLVPTVASLVVAGLLQDPWTVWLYFGFLGFGAGISHTAVSAMWAELYGVGSLGEIKSLVSALAVLSSALGPVIIGGLMDLGIPIERVCLYFAAYAMVATVLLAATLWRRPLVDTQPNY